MTSELTPTTKNNLPALLNQAGQAANGAAAASAFRDYRVRKAANTITRQDADLALFADYLTAAGLDMRGVNFSENPESWSGITWGLVEGFVKWQLAEGFAIGSINVRLSTVKTYARLALKAGALSGTDYALIRAVQGYSRKEGKRLDAARDEAGITTRRETRTGKPTNKGEPRKTNKKAAAVLLTPEQAAALKAQPDTPQGRRDALLMALLLEHGLRVGEVAGLNVGDFDLKAGTITFYRPKVDRMQMHELTPDTLKAARAYFEHDAPGLGCVWFASASKRNGKAKAGLLTVQGMSERAITKRVGSLGSAVGVEGLSAHDCRHYWATQAARSGTALDRLMDAGGWNSLAMPARYIEAAKVANQGVKLE